MDAGVPLPIPRDIGAGVEAAAFVLAVVPIVGRIFLAWLPPGLPGRHAPRDLPATWAASTLVGLTWFGWIASVVPGAAWPYFALGVPVVALVAGLTTSPAGLVPRHEPVAESASWLTSTCIALAATACAVIGALGEEWGSGILTGVSSLAAATLANEALATARVRPWARATVLSLLAVAIGALAAPEDDAGPLALIGACGLAAGAVAWIRRGDRRQLAIASVAVAYLAHHGPSGIPLALGGGTCLVIGSAKPSRLRALSWIGGAFVVGVLPRQGWGAVGPMDGLGAEGSEWIELAFLIAAAASFGATLVLSRRREPVAWNPSGAPVAREARVLACGALGAVAVVLGDRLVPSSEWKESLVPPIPVPTLSIWMLIAVAAAIALSRALERGPKPS